ncbi:putative nuclease HARBI1 [Toxorhynchites rutilus septentrionalis]|uniref:putative nuclease HARBI1 n=1 Tax=Toxorhynchites rutilus septentrionalis TaxID=329112 RepID=UPI002478F39C|nr:putative nuclease HARBI1 [Toxorhynchites rutilus septentrionalis]
MYSGDFFNLPFQPVVDVDGIYTRNRATKIYKGIRIGDDDNFKQLYRFSRENVDHLAQFFLGNDNETRGGALGDIQRMKCFLRYLGDPGFQVGVGEDLGIHQTTVCKTIWAVCKAIVIKANDWIRFPQTTQELEHEKKVWLSKHRMPGAIGAIDCTHILIKRPNIYKDEFINRKGLHSFNVQATCNAKEIFTSIDCKWAGSVHDARIWRNSEILKIMQQNGSGALLLADEAYPLAPWTMTPYRNPVTAGQKQYNKIHTQERVIIERCFGQIKQRFPILQSKVRVSTERIPRMIAACFVLHNVAKYVNDTDFEPYSDSTNCEINQSLFEISDTAANTVLQRGKQRRDAIASFLLARN